MEDPHMVEELMAAFDGGGTSWVQQQHMQQVSGCAACFCTWSPATVGLICQQAR